MDTSKVGTVIEPIKADWAQTTNMFDTVLGDRYARGFDEVYHASLESQEELMKKLYDTAMEDESLNEEQRHIIKACYVGFNQAICKNSVSTPLIAFVSSKKPVLSKAIKTHRKKGKKMVKSSRLKRTVEDLYGVMERIGFPVEVALLPELIRQLHARYIRREKEDDDGLTMESLILAALSAFARACDLKSYANLWYIAVFMRHIWLLVYVRSEVFKANLQFKARVANFVNTVRTIQVLEIKRMEVVPPPKEDTKPVKEESPNEGSDLTSG